MIGARPADPLGHSGVADLARREQADIEIGRNDRMVEEGLAGLHRVLVVAEFREAVAEEMAQRLEGAGARHRPAEGLEIAEVLGEVAIDELDHLAGDRIRREAQARRRRVCPWAAPSGSRYRSSTSPPAGLPSSIKRPVRLRISR